MSATPTAHSCSDFPLTHSFPTHSGTPVSNSASSGTPRSSSPDSNSNSTAHFSPPPAISAYTSRNPLPVEPASDPSSETEETIHSISIPTIATELNDFDSILDLGLSNSRPDPDSLPEFEQSPDYFPLRSLDFLHPVRYRRFLNRN